MNMREYKVKILVKKTGEPVNDTWYNEFGAKVWLERIARKNGYTKDELKISEVYECVRIFG